MESVNLVCIINYFQIVLCALSLINCFQRTDFNLFLFAFTLYVWNDPKINLKLIICYLFLWSSFADLIWVFKFDQIYSVTDFSSAFQLITCYSTLFISIAVLIGKIGYVILCYLAYEEIKIGFEFENLRDKVVALFSCSDK